jgi:cytochrome c oxidase subunit 3
MSDPILDKLPGGFKGMSEDIGSDQTAFKSVNWGKAMMWIFLLSDTFIFSCFLISYMKVRASVVEPWPYPSEVFALDFMGAPVPLLLIAIMTFVLITSSGTMALAVKYGYEKNKKMCGMFVLLTALGGLTFVGMQAFEWSKLIFHEGVRPWTNPFGAEQFGAFFFMITGFHGTHVSIGVIFLFIFARKVFKGDFDTGKRGFFTTMKSDYVAIEILGLYWHFVDLVWVFIFAFFYLW